MRLLSPCLFKVRETVCQRCNLLATSETVCRQRQCLLPPSKICILFGKAVIGTHSTPSFWSGSDKINHRHHFFSCAARVFLNCGIFLHYNGIHTVMSKIASRKDVMGRNWSLFSDTIHSAVLPVALYSDFKMDWFCLGTIAHWARTLRCCNRPRMS